jgi:hypothetical protein
MADQIRVKLSMHPDWPIERQLPNGQINWGKYDFYINQKISHCDYWVVLNSPFDKEKCECSPDRTLFVAFEPETIHRSNVEFLNQFAAVLTTQSDTRHPYVINSHVGHQWYAGVRFPDLVPEYNYTSLRNLQITKNEEKISVIMSTKTMSNGHEYRLKVLEKLKKEMPGKIDVYGKGFNEVPDKLLAIAPYKYHLAFENSYINDYWTEKLADTFIGWSLPLYWGCPNIEEYFSKASLIRLPEDNITDTVALVKKAVEMREYEKRKDDIAQARAAVLEHYNTFAVISRILDDWPLQNIRSKEHITIRDERFYTKRNRIAVLLRDARSEWRWNFRYDEASHRTPTKK